MRGGGAAALSQPASGERPGAAARSLSPSSCLQADTSCAQGQSSAAAGQAAARARWQRQWRRRRRRRSPRTAAAGTTCRRPSRRSAAAAGRGCGAGRGARSAAGARLRNRVLRGSLRRTLKRKSYSDWCAMAACWRRAGPPRECGGSGRGWGGRWGELGLTGGLAGGRGDLETGDTGAGAGLRQEAKGARACCAGQCRMRLLWPPWQRSGRAHCRSSFLACSGQAARGPGARTTLAGSQQLSPGPAAPRRR